MYQSTVLKDTTFPGFLDRPGYRCQNLNISHKSIFAFTSCSINIPIKLRRLPVSSDRRCTMKILVIGGTGMVGSTVVTGLLKQGVTVRVMSHSADKLKKLPKGVEGFRADLDDPDTLPAAFDGIDSVFLLNAVGLSETDEGLVAVSAAKAAKVKKIVYLSVFMPEGSEKIPHFRSKLPVEKAVKESGLAYTILRPNNFFQNDLWLKDAIMQYSVYPQPIGGKGQPGRCARHR